MTLLKMCSSKDGRKGGEDLVFSGDICDQKKPEEGNVLGPWVAVEFEQSGSIITVSNKSSPATNPPHVAVIKSFEYGFTDGMSVKFVIQDQQGGSFVQFIDNMMKEWACLEKGNPATVRMKFQWGWVKSGCKSTYQESRSRCHYALITSCETSFTDGKFTTELTGHDTGWRMLEGGDEEIWGGEGEQAMCLKEALHKLFTEAKQFPNVAEFDIKKLEGGVIQDAEFEYGCKNENSRAERIQGPPGKWVSNGQNKIQTAMRWLEGWRSWPKLRSWFPQYDSTVAEGRIVFWEDRRPKCGCYNDGYWDANCIGRYIVNGGKTSPVIEFNPQIRWDFGRLVSVGGTITDQHVGPMPPEGGSYGEFGGSKTPGRKDCKTLTRARQPGAGHTLGINPTANHENMHGSMAAQKTQEANEESFKALKVLHDEIRADLVIVGDPTLLPPDESRQRNIHIKFVNPFHLMGGTGCQDWTIQPPLNPALTNKAWLIDSVTHKIEAGNYTTTLHIYLTAPGKDGDVGQPMGLWCGAWTPKFCTG